MGTRLRNASPSVASARRNSRETTQHLVADQAAVGGEVDVRLDRRGVDADLAAAGDLQRPGQLDDPVVERFQRLGPDGVAPRIRKASSGTFSK